MAQATDDAGPARSRVSGAAAGGAERQGDYGRAYASGLTVSVVFAVAALVLAVRDVRRRPVGS